jgi:hypothetical protein
MVQASNIKRPSRLTKVRASSTPHLPIMSSSRCTLGHARNPIESLCRVFGIPTRLRRPPPLAATRSISQLHVDRNVLGQAHRRSILFSSSPRNLLEQSKNAFRSQRRTFSSSPPVFIMKPTGRFKTMEQIKSRANLGVLKISPGQALFRGASLTNC